MAGNVKKIVVDSSFVLAYLLPDETDILVDSIFKKYENGEISFISSQLLFYELLNGLKLAVLRKRIDRNLAFNLARKFLELDIEYINISGSEVLEVAIDKELTVYDGAYYFVSQKTGYPLLSMDSHLKKFSGGFSL